ncbi:MAG TPA: sugar phosphate isomerase/epimerase [Vicinamibacterales bacterium]|nr:sugar phosphate isomerase/epimerase [Vicinamibacterales bacterium]
MNRRTFLRTAGALVPLWYDPLGSFHSESFEQPSPRYKLGLQLFTMRAAMARDVDGTLKRVAGLGYEEVETYGFDPVGIRYYGLDGKAFAQRLRDNNLASPSGHYDLNRFMTTSVDDLRRYVDRCIEGARTLGQAYITWPLLDADSRTIEKFNVAAERLNIAGGQIKEAGLQLAYHNHDFEFVEQNGQIGYDIILKNTDAALVKLQMDLYWIAHGSKLSANEWFKRQPGRFVMWHVKDMHRTSRDYTEVGNGTVDFTRIWADAGLAGLKHFFVEQGGNFTHDPFRSIADSAEYVKRVLLK